jgi:hypothetical protein
MQFFRQITSLTAQWVHFPIADVELEAQSIDVGGHEKEMDRDDLVFDPYLAATNGDFANDAERRILPASCL